MFDLIDSLSPNVWLTSTATSQANFKEYQIIKQVRVDDVTMRVIINAENEDPKNVLMHDTLPKENPLKAVGRCLIQLNAEEKCIVGIDVEGDRVLRKS